MRLMKHNGRKGSGNAGYLMSTGLEAKNQMGRKLGLNWKLFIPFCTAERRGKVNDKPTNIIPSDNSDAQLSKRRWKYIGHPMWCHHLSRTIAEKASSEEQSTHTLL